MAIKAIKRNHSTDSKHQKMTNKEKFLLLVSKEETNFLQQIKWRKENQVWLRKSRIIALKILGTLREKKMSQNDLAELLDVSPEEVNIWVKGKDRFDSDTIVKIEEGLGIQLAEG